MDIDRTKTATFSDPRGVMNTRVSELSDSVAREVFGYRVEHNETHYSHMIVTWEIWHRYGLPMNPIRYDEDMNHAMLVVAEMQRRGWRLRLMDFTDSWLAHFTRHDDEYDIRGDEGKTAAEAICKAAIVTSLSLAGREGT